MELNLIQRLVRIMQKGEITDLEVDDAKEGLRLRIKRGPKASSGGGAPVVHVTQGAGAPVAPMAALAPLPAAAPGAEVAPGEANPPEAEGTPFTSPMVGTFYRSPSPDSDPFARVGTRVEEDSVICIIEAMKVMNEIKAERSGEVTAVLVENGEPVEFGQPLFMIK